MGRDRSTHRDKGKHVRSYHKQMVSPAWRDLSGSAIKVMMAMGLFENGSNNGEFFFSDRTGAEITGLSRNTVRRGIAELIDHGFIYCSERGGFSRKTPHAAKYGFTWLAGPPGEHRAPSHAYERWNGKTRAQNLTATGSVSIVEMETFCPTGSIPAPDEAEKRLVSVGSYFSDIEPQTVSQREGQTQAETGQRKQANSYIGAELQTLRQALTDRLAKAAPGEQSRLAEAIKIQPGTLSKFIYGRNLPERYRAPLARALRIKLTEMA